MLAREWSDESEPLTTLILDVLGALSKITLLLAALFWELLPISVTFEYAVELAVVAVLLFLEGLEIVLSGTCCESTADLPSPAVIEPRVDDPDCATLVVDVVSWATVIEPIDWDAVFVTDAVAAIEWILDACGFDATTFFTAAGATDGEIDDPVLEPGLLWLKVRLAFDLALVDEDDNDVVDNEVAADWVEQWAADVDLVAGVVVVVAIVDVVLVVDVLLAVIELLLFVRLL